MDIHKHTEYQLTLKRGTWQESMFRNSDNPTIKKLWQETMKDHENALVDSSRLDSLLMENAHMVHFGEDFYTEPYLQHFPCDIIGSGTRSHKNSQALPQQKQSPFLSVFNQMILNMKAAGVTDKFMKELTFGKGELDVSCGDGGDYKSLGYGNIFSVFIICGIGLVLAIFLCIIEWVHKHVRIRII